jgi:hypothetical protein
MTELKLIEQILKAPVKAWVGGASFFIENFEYTNSFLLFSDAGKTFLHSIDELSFEPPKTLYEQFDELINEFEKYYCYTINKNETSYKTHKKLVELVKNNKEKLQ